MKKVSVIITLYNYQKYIAECINSVLSQSYKNLEIIVVDDFSKDNGCEIVSDIINSNSNVKLIKLNANYGYSVGKNVGITCSSGDFICMLDADDMLLPDSIAKRVEKMNQGYDLVHGWAYNFTGKRRWENELRRKWIDGDGDPLRWKYIHPQGVMLRKSVHESVGLYDENLKCKSDREMWARVFNHNLSIGFIDVPVALYRQHQSQMHKSKWKKDNNKRLSSELMSLVEIRKKDISECIKLSRYEYKNKTMNGKQTITNEEAAPIAASSPQDLYKEDFFAKRGGEKHRYNFEMGKYAAMKLGMRSVVDLGCGIGSFISGVKASGVSEVSGVEVGYESAKKYLVTDVSESIRFGNVAIDSDFGKYDTAVSIEVAEHLLPEQADAFCRNLTRSSSRLIVITAAKPGQEGVYHFNCQPKEYWIEKIQSLGFTYRKDLSEKISDGWKKNIPGIPKYLYSNLMVFKIGSPTVENDKKKLNINSVNHQSGLNLSVSFDLQDNDSSGKHKFFQRIREDLRSYGYRISGHGEKSDIHFYINNPNANAKVNIKRLDGVYFDGTRLTKTRNKGILHSMHVADGIIYQSLYCKQYACKILNFRQNKPSEIIYNGCDPSEFAVQPVLMDKPYFLALCKWRRHKRLKESIDGFIHSGIQDHYLVVSGPPDYHIDHPLVKYVGDLNRKELARYIAGCIGTVHLAWIDWCPNSVVESIMAGKQVIHTNSGGTGEIVKGRGYQISDTIWMGEEANPKNPPELDIVEVAEAYRKSILNPISNFHTDDLHIKLSAEKYIEFGKKLLGIKK